MNFLTRNRKQAAIISGSLLVLTGVGATLAYGAIPAADASVHGCCATTNGVIVGITTTTLPAFLVEPRRRAEARRAACCPVKIRPNLALSAFCLTRSGGSGACS